MISVPEFPDDRFVLDDDPAYDRLRSSAGDRRDGRVYVHSARIRTAVRVAMATDRPLLIRGPAGSGKSSLAAFVARLLKWRYYSITVTARSQARDLMWDYDPLMRLADAQIAPLDADARVRVTQLENYVTPRGLWWAFDPVSAARRGALSAIPLKRDSPEDPGIGHTGLGAVVLIDEIDKADPDLPNNLLEALGSRQFTVAETNAKVEATMDVLVLITTNDERELPSAFVRRCAVLYLADHTPTELATIAEQQFGSTPEQVKQAIGVTVIGPVRALYDRVAELLERHRDEAKKLAVRPPSTAEYLDAVRASLTLGVLPEDSSDEWKRLAGLLLVKRDPKGQSV